MARKRILFLALLMELFFLVCIFAYLTANDMEDQQAFTLRKLGRLTARCYDFNADVGRYPVSAQELLSHFPHCPKRDVYDGWGRQFIFRPDVFGGLRICSFGKSGDSNMFGYIEMYLEPE